MKPFLALVKVNFKSLLLNSVNFGRGKKKAASGLGAFLLMAGIMLYLSGTYSFILASQLAPVGALPLMLMYMLMMALVAPPMITFYAAQSLVFSTKDVDLVLSLPVSSFSVMLARIMALYLEVLIITEGMLLPAGIAYAVFGGAGGVAVIPMLLLMGVFLAFLPTLVGLVVGVFISWVVAHSRLKNLINVLISLLSIVGIMAASIAISQVATATITTGLLEKQQNMPLPFALVIEAVTQFHIGKFLLVAAVCVAPFLLLAWLFSFNFKNLLSALASTELRTNYRLGKLKSAGVFSALLTKEAGRFFGTPILLLNSGFGILLLVGGSVFALLFKSKIAEMMVEMAGMGISGFQEMVSPLVLAFIGFVLSTVIVSGVSISLEGKTLWILKAAPVSVFGIFMAKAGFNFLLGALGCVVSLPMLWFAFGLPAADVACILLVSLLFGFFTSLSGLYINLLFPRLDAENEAVMIKQSASVIVTMLVGFVAGALLVGLFFILRQANPSFVLFSLVSAAVLGLLSAGTLALLNTKGRRLFAEL